MNHQLSEEENAIKEIQDEIHGEISEIIDLGTYHENTGAMGSETRLFFANWILMESQINWKVSMK